MNAFDEALATHEALRRLQFIPDHIFVSCDEERFFYVHLCIPGKQQVDIKLVKLDEASVIGWEDTWAERVHDWNKRMTESQRQEIYEGSIVFKYGAILIGDLIRAGLYPVM